MKDENTEPIEKRLTALEQFAERFQRDVIELRDDWEQERNAASLKAENEALREAVLRYAVACGAVDLQVAMLRARGEAREDVRENLQRCIEEQTEASNALRALARRLQNAPEG